MHCWQQNTEPKIITSKLVTPDPTITSIVSLAEFKQWVKWHPDDTSEDDIMQICIDSATQQAADYLGRVLLPGEWVTVFDGFYSSVKLDVVPVDVDSIVIQYYDSDNDIQTLSASNVKIKDYGSDRYTEIEFTGTMPNTYDRFDAVQITYDAGYQTFDARIKNAILIQGAGYFENRQSEVGGSTNAIVFGFHQMLFPLKMQ